MPSEEKVATPPIAASVVVPDSVPPAGFVPIATVTLLWKPVAVLPSASRAVTRTAGAMGPFAAAVLGCTVNTRWVAGPDVMGKAALGASDRPGAMAASVDP